MRYMLLQYLSGGEGNLYQIHASNGDFLRFADLEGNTLDSGSTPFSATLLEADVVFPSWHQNEEPPPAEEPSIPVPETITKRQFLIQLVRSGMVAAEEAATLPTQPPSLMDPILAALPAEHALEARLTWASMTQVERNSDLVQSTILAGVVTSAQLDAFFIAASEI